MPGWVGVVPHTQALATGAAAGLVRLVPMWTLAYTGGETLNCYIWQPFTGLRSDLP
jgi:hypothetical protein